MAQCNEILNDVSNQELENYNLEPGNTNKKKKKGERKVEEKIRKAEKGRKRE